MQDLSLIKSLGFILVAAAVFVPLAKLARVPSLVAYIITGLFLGPVTGIIAVSNVIDLIAEVGIALLLFLVGLELSLDRIRDVGRVAVLAGLGQVVFTAAGGFVVAVLLGLSVIEAVFVATALTFSSTVVVVKLLDQKRELQTLYGRIAVGIFLVQDLVVILALTILAGLGRPEAAGLPAVVRSLGLAFLGMAALLGTAMLAARYVLPRLFGWIAGSTDGIFIWSLCWCFLLVLGAEAMQLSIEIGAFLAGISLAQLPYNQDLRRRVHPLMHFFIAVFFVAVGVRMEFGAVALHAGAAAIFSVFVLLGNPLIFMWIIARLGYGEKTSFLTSVTVAQISEFSFIFAALGLSAGLIGQEILSLITVVGLVTIAVSSYMIIFNGELYEWTRRLGLLRVFRARQEEAGPPEQPPGGHVIVVGMNALGRGLVESLCRLGQPVLAIDTDPNKLAHLPCGQLLGSAEHSAVLEEARLAEARLLVSALHIEDTNNILAYRCRQLGVPCSIHAFDRSVVSELEEIGVSHLIRSKNAGVQRIAEELRKAGVLEE